MLGDEYVTLNETLYFYTYDLIKPLLGSDQKNESRRYVLHANPEELCENPNIYYRTQKEALKKRDLFQRLLLFIVRVEQILYGRLQSFFRYVLLYALLIRTFLQIVTVVNKYLLPP